MSLDKKELARFQKTADIGEITMMLGRYVTLMDRMDVMSIYEELFAKDAKDVSVEYDCSGTYIGPEHVKAFMTDFAKKMSDWQTKRGWLDFHDCATPHVVFSKDGNKAKAMWTMLSPKAKAGTPNPTWTAERTLTQFWQGGKMYWDLIRTKDGWKILHFQQITFFTTDYLKGWVAQQECHRDAPFWALKPDRKPRFYVYHPDQVYVKDGQYNYGPYLPEDGSF